MSIIFNLMKLREYYIKFHVVKFYWKKMYCILSNFKKIETLRNIRLIIIRLYFLFLILVFDFVM